MLVCMCFYVLVCVLVCVNVCVCVCVLHISEIANLETLSCHNSLSQM